MLKKQLRQHIAAKPLLIPFAKLTFSITLFSLRICVMESETSLSVSKSFQQSVNALPFLDRVL